LKPLLDLKQLVTPVRLYNVDKTAIRYARAAVQCR